MKTASIFTLVMILLLLGCAGFSEKNRMENFSRTANAYEQALRMSDYDSAVAFCSPSTFNAAAKSKKFKNIKIIEYKIARLDVSKDNLEIKQDVELQYFLLNSNRLRTMRHPQTWRYREKEKIWLLETGLPAF